MKRFPSICCSLCAALAAYLFVGPAALALGVNPVVLELLASGSKRAATVEVTNDSAAPMPVEVLTSRLELDENGKATTTAVEAFTIVPRLATIMPGRSQKIRIQWNGDPNISKSQSFIVSVKQVGVQFPAAQSGMKVLLNMGVIVNVAPNNATSSLDLISSGVGRDEDGKLRPQIVVQNKGKRHASLSDATITLTNGQNVQTLTPPKLKVAMGAAIVQPGKTRRFLLPIDPPAGPGPLAVRVDYMPLVTSSTSN